MQPQLTPQTQTFTLGHDTRGQAERSLGQKDKVENDTGCRGPRYFGGAFREAGRDNEIPSMLAFW